MRSVALVISLLLAGAPASALPKKVVIDEDDRPLDDVAMILRSIKADGWTPAKPIIDKLTVVMMIPVTRTPSGVTLDRFLLAQSRVGETKSIAFKGEISKGKIANGMKPVAQPASHVFVVDHPVPIDTAQTMKPLRIIAHASTDGRVTVFIGFRGVVTRMRAPATVENRFAVDESTFFKPTKTHTLGLDVPGERLRDLDKRERALLWRVSDDPAAFVRLVDALALEGAARAAARRTVFASGDEPVEPGAPVAP